MRNFSEIRRLILIVSENFRRSLKCETVRKSSFASFRFFLMKI